MLAEVYGIKFRGSLREYDRPRGKPPWPVFRIKESLTMLRGMWILEKAVLRCVGFFRHKVSFF